MATTMREVAEAAGVSIATVSFVVNNSKRVAPETRERIERVIVGPGHRLDRNAGDLGSAATMLRRMLLSRMMRRRGWPRLRGNGGDWTLLLWMLRLARRTRRLVRRLIHTTSQM